VQNRASRDRRFKGVGQNSARTGTCTEPEPAWRSSGRMPP
jgi:hypothetical protein